ncbi:MAG: deoxynucleoside kinase [Romboutsia sp.]|uniref:deoxynucleoside kinase n=1 Tax=Clostridium sp. DSM 8431 TaxID=1761781 RepID=UPI0008E3792C|nr:deoxynucleoside kinase [Clostridium sp. DSM 8431]MBQ3421543.1 deoxynucleoside kinase [Romboutsia sp.]SFU75933.1 Deoxyadenosine/deoxycytidine kinase [Clostridium sp. DSM 8431]
MVIVVGGMIGLGKSSVAEVLGKHFDSEVFYESVDNNPILPLFYSETEEEIAAKRYPFLLQLYFLNTRFKSIKDALINDKNVLDRSIYEDWYFAKKNMELGRISELEMSIYEELLNNMMQELDSLPKKAPDLMVYLKGSFDTVMKRIKLRGRDFELDDSLIDYYKFLWEGYDEWVQNKYNASQVLIIDMDVFDVVNSEDDREKLIELVEEKLKEM